MFRKQIFTGLAVLLLISCKTGDNTQLLTTLHHLEWTRVADTTAYLPYWRSENPAIRAELCLSVGKIQAPELFPILSDLVRDPDTTVVQHAIFALGQMRSDRSTGLLETLFRDPDFGAYRIGLLKSIGKSETAGAYEFLLSSLESLPEPLLAEAVRGVAYLTEEATRNRSAGAIKEYLRSRIPEVRDAAVYYFARHPDPTVLAPLIRTRVSNDGLSAKYRFRAIERTMAAKWVLRPDSSLEDSLRREVGNALRKNRDPWQTRLYQIGILGNFDDSVSVALVAKQLQDTIPHIRLKAIESLGEKNTDNAEKILLNYYNQAGWGEKGNIIYVVSRHDRNLAYRLIQQNLDQGTPYFKQLLLRSLARIRDRASLGQLRQFLQVPNVRLQQTAFMELNELNLITYDQVQPLLSSGDMVLIWLAADWISKHPDKARLSDLIRTYQQLNEDRDAEPMTAILAAVAAIKDREAVPFLKEVLTGTKKKLIADQIVKILTDWDVRIETLPQVRDSLFIPPEIVPENAQIVVRITTTKGDIDVRLRPDAALLTVSNFMYLMHRGFYQNILFHRVVSDFVIQAGDPRGDGWGGPGYSIPCEYNRLPFMRGTMGMATAGKDTGGSQFFICHSEQPHLDRRYTVFGQVIKGLDVVDKIEIDDQITQITQLN